MDCVWKMPVFCNNLMNALMLDHFKFSNDKWERYFMSDKSVELTLLVDAIKMVNGSEFANQNQTSLGNNTNEHSFYPKFSIFSTKIPRRTDSLSVINQFRENFAY